MVTSPVLTEGKESAIVQGYNGVEVGVEVVRDVSDLTQNSPSKLGYGSGSETRLPPSCSCVTASTSNLSVRSRFTDASGRLSEPAAFSESGAGSFAPLRVSIGLSCLSAMIPR
jgi:hypothetical protein